MIKLILTPSRSSIYFNDIPKKKESIKVTYDDDGEHLSFTIDGMTTLVNLHFSEIGYLTGEEETAFTSMQELETYIDRNFYKELPYPIPVKFVAVDGTNCKMLKGGGCLINSITAINKSTSARYLKIYDQTTEPNPETDSPIQTFYIPGVEVVVTGIGTEGEQISYNKPPVQHTLLGNTVKHYAGLAIAITAEAADNDITPINGGDVLLNFLLQ